MFEREHHRRIADVLTRLDADLLRSAHCLFGGGTAMALRYGEYRESVDIDFLVSDVAGYRKLRQRLTGPLHQGGFGAGPHLGVPGGEAGFPIAHLRRRGLGGCRDRQDAQQHAADEQVSHGRSRASMRV